MSNHAEHTNFIWQIADLLRGPYRPPQYERVMLPMTVLRRFDCVLQDTKEKVLRQHEKYGPKFDGAALDEMLNRASGQQFHNHSPLDFERLKGSPDTVRQDLVRYINSFSENVKRIFDFFDFEKEIEKMSEENILYLIVSSFANVDLHPERVGNHEMGQIFEHLIRKFNEMANETAGDYFTPREIIELMIHILFNEDDKLLTVPGTIRTMLDPCCGTGGMLAEAQSYINEHNAGATLYTYGQDYNRRAYATAASDMLMKEVAHNGRGDNIKYGDSLINDQFESYKFDYLISNPPFGVDWKKQRSQIKDIHDLGDGGKFPAGLPRVNDGSLLFLQHMIDKFEPVDMAAQQYGSRMAVVFSGSALFAGGAGSGESNIRQWVIENDWLEAIVALPEAMYYNTGIGTYIWVLTNRKAEERKGKVQLVDARGEDYYIPMRRSLGSKRRKLGQKEEGEPDQVGDIVRLYGRFQEHDDCKILPNEAFGTIKVTVERPLRLTYQMSLERKSAFLNTFPHLLDDIQALDKQLGREPLRDWNKLQKQLQKIIKTNGSKWKAHERKAFRQVFAVTDPEAKKVKKGKGYEPDPALRDYENVPLSRDVDEYFTSEVLPHLPDAWMDRSKDKTGYEINFNRHFYKYEAPRDLSVIDKELEEVEEEILRLLKGIVR
ncbi:type I restriction-modification system subunit M [Neolewinella agarilytica]|uniref:site-specific DNA-methyltransferase (adenine-specific) n=1 Tax=Neolewinella agarilytica TaxID=478744 RepID=A0A1H9HDS9_9BACT|nr:class I SAM-dependent DNA methyltransferase [Neolewinella agarilytica]SEQ60346.1 type I restriction enzyme M protein [Neolewinella agarilytica]